MKSITTLICTLGMTLSIVHQSEAADAGKMIFFCSEIDSILTPVDTVSETSEGYLIQRFQEQKMLGQLLLMRDQVLIEQLPDEGLSFSTKDGSGPNSVMIVVKGHASSMKIKSAEINVDRKSVICVKR